MLNSLNKKIVTCMIFLTLLCTISLTVVSYLMVKNSMIIQMKNEGSTLISVLSKQIEKYQSSDLEQIQESFRSIVDKNMQSLEYISIVDKNLNIVVDDVKVTGIKNNVDGVTTATKQGNIDQTLSSGSASGFIFETNDGKNVYNVSAPITLLDGFTGFINIGISLTPMYHQLNVTLENILIISIVIQIITILVALIIGKSLTKPLSKIVALLKKVEENDLSVELNIQSKDEIEKVSNAVNNTVENLRNTITTIKTTTNTLNQSSTVLAKSAMESSSFSQEIAASVEEVNAIIENQNGSILSIVDSFTQFSNKLDSMIGETNNILDGNNKISKRTIDGYDQLQVLINSINEVRELCINSRDRIDVLNNNILKIDEITNVINTVAEQTNLLSLNASIEASRVGELGTGFGVVADEIRSLSEQVRESSDNINQIVRLITNNSKSILDQSVIISYKMEAQITTINETVDSCNEIKEEVEKSTIYAKGVANSLNTIKVDKDNITEAVNEVSNISIEITESTEEVAATLMNQTENSQKISELGETLNGIAKELDKMVDKFIV